MELSIVIFFFILLIPGLWLVLSIGREFRQREVLNEQRRIEQERVAHLVARRRAPSRSAPHRTHPTVEPFAQATAVSVAPPAPVNEAAAGGESSAQGSSRTNMRTPQPETAFEGFLSATPPPPSDQFGISRLDEAFEQFMNETQPHAAHRATR
jgi:hypothetical protein